MNTTRKARLLFVVPKSLMLRCHSYSQTRHSRSMNTTRKAPGSSVLYILLKVMVCVKIVSVKNPVLWIRIRRIRMFLDLLDSDPDPVVPVRGTDPDPDPYQNVTDPQHWKNHFYSLIVTCSAVTVSSNS
jgi:hypothetical protein